MALSLGSPPVAVSDHPALWSPDFPPASGERSPDPLPHFYTKGLRDPEFKDSRVFSFHFHVTPRTLGPLSPILIRPSYFLIYRLVGQLIGPPILFPGYMMDMVF